MNTSDIEGERTFRVLGIAGSLRAGSYNRSLLNAAIELAPAEMEISVFEGLADIPHYNADVDAAGDPEAVTRLKEAITAADGLLIVTPEYNYGIPGVLKNAIDWASRPVATSVLRDKPAAIMGATGGMGATIRAQTQLREVFVATQTHVLLQPQVLVTRASEKFDENGRLTDEPTRAVVAKTLKAFAAWIERLG